MSAADGTDDLADRLAHRLRTFHTPDELRRQSAALAAVLALCDKRTAGSDMTREAVMEWIDSIRRAALAGEGDRDA